MISMLLTGIKKIILLIDCFILTILFYLVGFIPFPKCLGIKQWLFHHWTQAFLSVLGIKLQIHQLYHHHLPKQYIVIGNHPSLLEDLILPVVLPARFLSKASVQKWWLVGRVATSIGTIYVNRRCKADRAKAKQDLVDILNQGHNIGLFPEGGCHGRHIHLPFKNGAFEAAFQTQVPIVPTFVHYPAQADFEWKDENAAQKLYRIFKSQNKTIHHYIFDPIDPKSFKDIHDFKAHIEQLYLIWEKKYLH